jgi:glycosyltransferase involved in cell wall biosynthesis
MLVTVVTPTLNASAYLDECIRSVQRQAGPGVTVEHLVVDGGSTDGTVELARSMGATVLEGPDSGLYDADNKGTAASSGELIGYLGADDLLLPGAIGAVVRTYERDRNPWVVGGLRWIDGEGRSLGDLAAPPRWTSSSMMAALGWCCISQQAAYVTRDLFDELDGFDTEFKIAGDYDFYCTALEKARWSRVPRTLACFRRHGTNLSMSGAQQQTREYEMIMERHAPTSRLRQVVEGQVLRFYLNARNPTWAFRKKVGAGRLSRPSAPADSSG